MANGDRGPWIKLILIILAALVILPAMGMIFVRLVGEDPEALRTMGCWGLAWLMMVIGLLVGLALYFVRKSSRK